MVRTKKPREKPAADTQPKIDQQIEATATLKDASNATPSSLGASDKSSEPTLDQEQSPIVGDEILADLIEPPPQSSPAAILVPPDIPPYQLDFKKSKIWNTFDLSEHDIMLLLQDCQFNEDEVMVRLITQPGYLARVQQGCRPATMMSPSNANALPLLQPLNEDSDKEASLTAPTRKQINMQPFLAPKPAASQEPNTIVPSCTTSVSTASLSSCPPTPLPSPGLPERKKRVRSVGRLALDDAIKQVQVHNNPEQAFQGWSEARLRAYRMIDTNPNSYYYRFNAPGEEQAKGPWTELEKQLFLDRLKELGANSQWGVFSMVIPGRVGYQCSNYYRYLIEIGELQDTNYIVDEKGKAHYLFDKKTPFGTVEKTLRTHIKHGSRKREVPKKPKKPTWQDDDTDDGEYNPRHKKKKKKSKRPY